MISYVDWQSLVFGRFSLVDVQTAVHDETWQDLRVSLLGLPLEQKYVALTRYLEEAKPEELSRRRIQVTNYVHALRRGGILR